ncbi:MAG: twin-arginine translocation signal domain-containing protein [Hyphomonadaceae bacterium]|nr:twin-arginine translocation signal domain-containing protein [Hyphomonadaceae bacterium]
MDRRAFLTAVAAAAASCAFGAVEARLLGMHVLPDAAGGAGPGGGFSATGLSLDPVTGGWVVGNDGRATDPQTTYDPSIVFLDAHFRKHGELKLAPLYFQHGSVQGVAALKDGSIWYASPLEGLVRRIDRSGRQLARFSLPWANGVAVSRSGAVWALAKRKVWRMNEPAPRFSVRVGDGLCVAAGALWCADHDALHQYGFDGRLMQRYVLPGVNYAEGVVVRGDEAWVVHNGSFHRSSRKAAIPPRSVIAHYALS